MLNEIRELGFHYAELSHGIRVSLLQGIFDAVDAGEIKISSLHNFCPLPLGVNYAAPNIFRFTSPVLRERESAFRHTLRTIETAARVGAPFVVLHLGSVDMQDYSRRLKSMLADGQRESPKYEKLCSEAILKRESRKKEHYERALELLERLCQEAKKEGVKLAIENREALEEIPFETDFDTVLRLFPDSIVVYWHDTGHAQIKENMGFIYHSIFLEGLVHRLGGFHIHDVKYPDADHRPPGEGSLDFLALKPYVKPEHPKVFEFSPACTKEQILNGVAYLKSIWGDT